MKTVFDQNLRAHLISRIQLLNEESKPEWGKMNVFQMSRHCSIWNDWVLGKSKQKHKQSFIGKIFGKIALKTTLKDDKPMGKNMPAGIFVVKEKEGNLNIQKEVWTSQIAEYSHFSNEGFVHDFFGRMSKEQIGIFVYQHMDHHLRQFGV
ncbi:DUF1569 domain-containing protein [Sphingobacterium sp. UBA5789]|nr:DUF1569 domain-containing protein [Sphingobacterium sp. UBA5789]